MYSTTQLRVKLFETLTNTEIELSKIVLGVPVQVWDALFKKDPDAFDEFIAEVSRARAEAGAKKREEELTKGFISSVTFNPPYTTVTWQDGTVTRVICATGDTYSKEQGLLYCIAKRFYENEAAFNNVISYWMEHGKETDSYAKRQEKKKEKTPLFSDYKDKIIYIAEDSDVETLVSKIVNAAYVESSHDVYWKVGETLLLQTILHYMNYSLPAKEMTVSTLMSLIESVINKNGDIESSKLGQVLKQETDDAFPGALAYERLCTIYKKNANDIAYLAGMHVLNYVEKEDEYMARICPQTKEPVLYADCLECENKAECRNLGQNVNTEEGSTENKSEE